MHFEVTSSSYIPEYDPHASVKAPAASQPSTLGPTDVDLTDSEVKEIKQILGEPAEGKLEAQEVMDKLRGWVPTNEGYFTENRRMLLLGATWMVKSGRYRELKDRDDNLLFCDGCDNFYTELHLGCRQTVSRDLNRQRLYQLLPAHLKARVKGPGCIDPLLSLNSGPNEKRERAFEALTAWNGTITAIASEAAKELSTGPIEPNLSAAMKLKVGIRQNETVLESLTNTLKRIPEDAVRPYSLGKQLIDALAEEKPILVAGLPKSAQVTATPSPKTAETTAQSDHAKFTKNRAEIDITPELVSITIANSGRAIDLIMGLINHKAFGFEKIKKGQKSAKDQKPAWVSAQGSNTTAGQVLRGALRAFKNATGVSLPPKGTQKLFRDLAPHNHSKKASCIHTAAISQRTDRKVNQLSQL